MKEKEKARKDNLMDSHFHETGRNGNKEIHPHPALSPQGQG